MGVFDGSQRSRFHHPRTSRPWSGSLGPYRPALRPPFPALIAGEFGPESLTAIDRTLRVTHRLASRSNRLTVSARSSLESGNLANINKAAAKSVSPGPFSSAFGITGATSGATRFRCSRNSISVSTCNLQPSASEARIRFCKNGFNAQLTKMLRRSMSFAR